MLVIFFVFFLPSFLKNNSLLSLKNNVAAHLKKKPGGLLPTRLSLNPIPNEEDGYLGIL